MGTARKYKVPGKDASFLEYVLAGGTGYLKGKLSLQEQAEAKKASAKKFALEERRVDIQEKIGTEMPIILQKLMQGGRIDLAEMQEKQFYDQLQQQFDIFKKGLKSTEEQAKAGRTWQGFMQSIGIASAEKIAGQRLTEDMRQFNLTTEEGQYRFDETIQLQRDKFGETQKMNKLQSALAQNIYELNKQAGIDEKKAREEAAELTIAMVNFNQAGKEYLAELSVYADMVLANQQNAKLSDLDKMIIPMAMKAFISSSKNPEDESLGILTESLMKRMLGIAESAGGTPLEMNAKYNKNTKRWYWFDPEAATDAGIVITRTEPKPGTTEQPTQQPTSRVPGFVPAIGGPRLGRAEGGGFSIARPQEAPAPIDSAIAELQAAGVTVLDDEMKIYLRQFLSEEQIKAIEDGIK